MLKDDHFVLALISQAQKKLNWHCAELLEVFTNIAKLEWFEQILPGNSIEQLGLDIIRRLITANIERCKDYFAADVGHVCRRDSVVGSRSRGRARRREGRLRSAVGDEERERETRRVQNGTERVNRVLFDCLAMYTGYVLYTTGLEAPMWYVQGGTVAVRTVRLGARNSEFGTRSSSR